MFRVAAISCGDMSHVKQVMDGVVSKTHCVSRNDVVPVKNVCLVFLKGMAGQILPEINCLAVGPVLLLL